MGHYKEDVKNWAEAPRHRETLSWEEALVRLPEPPAPTAPSCTRTCGKVGAAFKDGTEESSIFELSIRLTLMATPKSTLKWQKIPETQLFLQ